MKNFLKILIEPRLPGILIPFFLSIILWVIPLFFAESSALWVKQNTAFSTALSNYAAFSPLWAKFIAFLFSIFIGFVLLQLNNRFSFIRMRNSLLFFFYIILIGTNIQLHHFDFSQLSVLFLLLIVWQLFASYDTKQPVFNAFNIGLFVALGSFFSVELLLFWPVLLFGIQRLKGLTTRTFLANTLGLLTPFLFFIGLAFILDGDVISYFYLFIKQFEVIVYWQFTMATVIYLVVLSAFAIIAIHTIIKDPFSDKIKVSRMLSFIAVAFVFFVVLFFLKSNNLPIIFILATVFSSMLYAHFFSLKNSLITRILFFTLLFFCLLNYLFTLFSITL